MTFETTIDWRQGEETFSEYRSRQKREREEAERQIIETQWVVMEELCDNFEAGMFDMTSDGRYSECVSCGTMCSNYDARVRHLAFHLRSIERSRERRYG